MLCRLLPLEPMANGKEKNVPWEYLLNRSPSNPYMNCPCWARHLYQDIQNHPGRNGQNQPQLFAVAWLFKAKGNEFFEICWREFVEMELVVRPTFHFKKLPVNYFESNKNLLLSFYLCVPLLVMPLMPIMPWHWYGCCVHKPIIKLCSYKMRSLTCHNFQGQEGRLWGRLRKEHRKRFSSTRCNIKALLVSCKRQLNSFNFIIYLTKNKWSIK